MHSKHLLRAVGFTLLILMIIITPVKASLDIHREINQEGTRSGDKLSDEVQLSLDGDAERYFPAVAYNTKHNEYLVVWHNTWGGGLRDIYARRVSASGELLSWFCVATGVYNRAQPAVAYNATNDEYLIVWMKEWETNKYSIDGRIIPWNGPGTNPEVTIQSHNDRSFWAPRVVWNSHDKEYAVVSNVFDINPLLARVAEGARVSPSGLVVQPFLQPITYFPTDHPLDFAYNPERNEYILVSVRPKYLSGTTGNDIYVWVIGFPPSTMYKTVSYTVEWDGDQNNPAVSVNQQGKMLVVWEHVHSATDIDIYGVQLDQDGHAVGSHFGLATSGVNETEPDISAGENEWLLVYQEALPAGSGQAVKGLHWGTGIDLYRFDIANYIFWENEKPTVAAGKNNYLIAYEGDSSSTYRHIFGRVWWPIEPTKADFSTFLPIILR